MRKLMGIAVVLALFASMNVSVGVPAGANEDPVVVDPPPIGGIDLNPIVATVFDALEPYVIDPDPINYDVGAMIDEAIDILGPVIADPGPVGYDLQPIVDALKDSIAEISVDPPPVGYDLRAVFDTLIAALNPIYVDPPPVGYDLAETTDRLIALIGPIVADPPPLGYDLRAVMEALKETLEQIAIDPPPVGPIYVDPPEAEEIVADPPPVGGGSIDTGIVDPVCLPQADVDVGPVLDQIDELVEHLQDSVADLKDLIDVTELIDYLEDLAAYLQQVIGESIDPGPLVGDIKRLLDGIAIEWPEAPAVALEDLAALINSYAAAQSANAVELAPVCVDPDAGEVNIPRIDPQEIVIVVPDPCPGMSGCQVAPGIDPPPVGVTGPDPCAQPGSPVCEGEIDPAPIEVEVKDPCDQFGSTICQVEVDPEPIGVDVPNPCDQFGSLVCQVEVDADPVTVLVPDPCQELLGCQVEYDPGGIMIDNPCDPSVTCEGTIDPSGYSPENPCDRPSIPCVIPTVDPRPIVIDPIDPCTEVAPPALLNPCPLPGPLPTVDPEPDPLPTVPPPPGGIGPLPDGGLVAGGTTPLGQVLVVTANVLQRGPAATDTNPCPDRLPGQTGYKEAKRCESPERRRAFADRIRALADKLTYDGMGYVPDVVALQETNRDTADEIASLLSFSTGMGFVVGTHGEDFDSPFSENPKADTAILYNTRTMSPSGSAVPIMTDHSEVDKKRHVMMGFRETLPPVYSETSAGEGVEIALASIHYSFGFEDNDKVVATATKANWSQDIAAALEANFPLAQLHAIAGDFNEVRCDEGGAPNLLETEGAIDEGNPVSAGQPYVEPLVCDERPMHATLLGRGYLDSIYAANARTSSQLEESKTPNIGPAEDIGTLNRQYRDGEWFRPLRIDHIFARGADSFMAASHDISCGEYLAPVGKRTCKWLQSPERYSDHSFVWALMGVNPKPSQSLVDPDGLARAGGFS